MDRRRVTEVIVDYRDSAVERTSWRTYAVLAHTMSASAKIVARAGLGRLAPDGVDRILVRWCDHIFRLSRATLLADGVANVAPGQPYVLLSNHQSLFDIPAVLTAFPGRLRFVAKQELRSVPVFGKAMEIGGAVFVDRTDRERAIDQLKAARQQIEQGTSVWIAVEGTRSRDGTLGPFKKGGFHVAMDLGIPILPTVIEGSLDVIPPDQWRSVTGQTVQVSFGAPIPTAGLGRPDLDRLMAQTRAALLALAKPAV